MVLLLVIGCPLNIPPAETEEQLSARRLSDAKAVTAFSFDSVGALGTIDESAKTIAVTVPYATDVTALVATFTTTGKTVKAGPTVQVSGTTPNNFTSPVTYTVTAANGSTAKYRVTVTVAPSSSKAISAFSFASPPATGTVDENAKTIAVDVPAGKSVTALVATFTITGRSAKVGSTAQESGTTANDFSAPVTYVVTAADGSTASYVVTVTVQVAQLPSAKAITAFSFANLGVTATIDESAKTIRATVPYGTDLTALVATFTTTGVSVTADLIYYASVPQVSGSTANNFSQPVIYHVTAADGSTAAYGVIVTWMAQPPSSPKAITGFWFASPAVTGTVDENTRKIWAKVSFGTNLAALVASFTTTGASVKVGPTVQVSGTTANNFSAPVTYTVTAIDGSTASYTVTVYVVPSITAFSFPSLGAMGTILPDGGIRVSLPSGTNVTALVASFSTTPVGARVVVGSTVQVSDVTANNFSGGQLTYWVYPQDGSEPYYNVVGVTVAPPSITAFSFASPAATGTVNESAKSIAVSVPAGTNVTALVASLTTAPSEASVKVGSTIQVSGATSNNFSSPVTYTVTAADGAATSYTVFVTVAASPSGAKAITSFVLAGTAATIDENAKTISAPVPYGTNVTALVANFTWTGASIKVDSTAQVSGTTTNDFTRPVIYTVTAADGSTVNYAVTAHAPIAITTFTLKVSGPAESGRAIIDDVAKTIKVTVPYGANVSALVAFFATTGVSVKVGSTVQMSGVSANNFSAPVTYTVTGADGSTANYTVSVAFQRMGPSSARIVGVTLITYYYNEFVGPDPQLWDITACPVDENGKVILPVLPSQPPLFASYGTWVEEHIYTAGAVSLRLGSTEYPLSETGEAVLYFTGDSPFTVTALDGTAVDYLWAQ